MQLLDAPIAGIEFLCVDTETNGRGGDGCEVTEIGAVLVGGGELHDRWSTLVAARRPLSPGIQRFTGITQDMLAGAPAAAVVLPGLADLLAGRVLVAHNAAFDRRVLRQAFEREGLTWPDPPALCTVALARRVAPLVRQRRLGALADALGIEVQGAHRALADAETCARVLCALLPRLAAHAATVGQAIDLLGPARPRRSRGRTLRGSRGGPGAKAGPDVSALPEEPGVYLFRNAKGQLLYVGKSVSLRTRARAHLAPSSAAEAWTAQAAVVDHRTTRSELGALLLERRLIRELRPPGNAALKHRDGFVYLRCRLDIPFPVLEVAAAPAPGHGVTVGPLRSRAAAVELVEQLNSLFGLRHCGRSLPRRSWPSAYGQMGRCLSPCLQDLDPNAYRRRLDQALDLFRSGGDGGAALLAHVEAQMAAAADERRYERAAWLRRRHRRLAALVDRLAGTLAALHATPALVAAAHPRGAGAEAFWLVGGRVADSGTVAGAQDLVERTRRALAGGDGRARTAHLPPEAVEDLRVVSTWSAAHAPPTLALAPAPSRRALERFATGALLL